jgi:hypothetical protein
MYLYNEINWLSGAAYCPSVCHKYPALGSDFLRDKRRLETVAISNNQILTVLTLAAYSRYQEISTAKSVITPIDPHGETDKLALKRGRFANLAIFP